MKAVVYPFVLLTTLCGPCFRLVQARLPSTTKSRDDIHPEDILGRFQRHNGTVKVFPRPEKLVNPPKPVQTVERDLEASEYDVIVVGAGAAGLGAARRLLLSGVTNVVILEATSWLGGRAQMDDEFQGYPLDLGPSYIPTAFWREMQDIAGDDDFAQTIFPPGGGSRVFKDYSYNQFFADHMAPGLNIMYDCAVTTVNYESTNVNIQCEDERTFASRYAVVTSSLAILQSGAIDFVPSLEVSLTNHRGWWPGFKIFLQFKSAFYPNSFSLGSGFYNSQGEILFWDYTISAPSSSQVPPLLAGYIAGRIYELGLTVESTEEEIVNAVLQNINNQQYGEPGTNAFERYVDHLLMNWSQQPYVRGLFASEGVQNSGARIIQDKVLLAGEAYPIYGEEWAWVYSAFHSGFDAADKIFALKLSEVEGTWIHWNSASFDSGLGNLWMLPNSDLNDAVRSMADSYCPQSSCIRLRSNSGAASSLTSAPIDVTDFSKVRLSFEFYMYRFEVGENLVLEFFSDSSWQPITRLDRNDDGVSNNDMNFYVSVLDTESISGEIAFRFRSEASGSNDRIYLDNVVISVQMEGQTLSPTTVMPSFAPTFLPTFNPTSAPIASPTANPVEAGQSVSPTDSPTLSPTVSPTSQPTSSPTLSPTDQPTSSPTMQSLSWELVYLEDFEDGAGVWDDSVPDVRRKKDKPNLASSGSGSLQIRHTGSTFATINVAGKTRILVEFYFKALDVAYGESMEVAWASQSSGPWTTKTFTRDPSATAETGWVMNGLENIHFRSVDFDISSAFSDTVLVRFSCVASENNDRIFLDNIGIYAK